MRLMKFRKQSVPVSASTPIQYSPASAPLVETHKKGHSPVSLLKNVLYISISLLHTCCICVAFDVNSSTSDGIPQLL